MYILNIIITIINVWNTVSHNFEKLDVLTKNHDYFSFKYFSYFNKIWKILILETYNYSPLCILLLLSVSNVIIPRNYFVPLVGTYAITIYKLIAIIYDIKLK